MAKYRIITEKDNCGNTYYPEYRNFLGFWCRWEGYPFCDYSFFSLEEAESFIKKKESKSGWGCQCSSCKVERPKLF